jgi:hypothetical protein
MVITLFQPPRLIRWCTCTKREGYWGKINRHDLVSSVSCVIGKSKPTYGIGASGQAARVRWDDMCPQNPCHVITYLEHHPDPQIAYPSYRMFRRARTGRARCEKSSRAYLFMVKCQSNNAKEDYTSANNLRTPSCGRVSELQHHWMTLLM